MSKYYTLVGRHNPNLGREYRQIQGRKLLTDFQEKYNSTQLAQRNTNQTNVKPTILTTNQIPTYIFDENLKNTIDHANLINLRFENLKCFEHFCITGSHLCLTTAILVRLNDSRSGATRIMKEKKQDCHLFQDSNTITVNLVTDPTISLTEIMIKKAVNIDNLQLTHFFLLSPSPTILLLPPPQRSRK